MRRCLVLLAALPLVHLAHAGSEPVTDRTAIIDGVVRHVRASYIDAGGAARLEPILRRADFSKATDDAAFADAVTAAMHAATKDQHLRLFYSAKPVPEPKNGLPTPAEIAARQAELREAGYGIERVERLPGNIGYLKTTFFAPAGDAGPAIAAAMTLLAHTDALIVDLRDNDGGAADCVPLVASYLFDERARLGDLYRREDDATEQQWTYPAVAGERFGGNKPVYVLTGKATFSAAEGLAFALKNLKRATIVGETTRGGAHPARIKRIDDHYALMVPVSTVRDAVTGKDWEGVGVAPDVPVPAARALVRAQVVILDKMLADAPDAQRRAELRKRLDDLHAEH